MCLCELNGECLFIVTAIYHAADYAQCQRADAKRGECAHQNVGGRTRHREPGAKSHIRRKANWTLRHECEQGSRQNPTGSFPRSMPQGLLLTRFVLSARHPFAAKG
jgi:hypothetical protein